MKQLVSLLGRRRTILCLDYPSRSLSQSFTTRRRCAFVAPLPPPNTNTCTCVDIGARTNIRIQKSNSSNVSNNRNALTPIRQSRRAFSNANAYTLNSNHNLNTKSEITAHGDAKRMPKQKPETTDTQTETQTETESNTNISTIEKTNIMHEGRGGDEPYPDAKDINEWMQLVWADYKFTWVGFLNQNNKRNKRDDDDDDYPDQDRDKYGMMVDRIDSSIDTIDTQKILAKQKELRDNVDRNVDTIQKEGGAMLTDIKEMTGIYNQRDLKKWAMEQLKLANECVKEFMGGYRQGRDEEVDNMMNEYFKDIDFGNDDGNDGKDVNDDENDDDNNGSDAKEIIKGPATKEKVAGRIRRRIR